MTTIAGAVAGQRYRGASGEVYVADADGHLEMPPGDAVEMLGIGRQTGATGPSAPRTASKTEFAQLQRVAELAQEIHDVAYGTLGGNALDLIMISGERIADVMIRTARIEAPVGRGRAAVGGKTLSARGYGIPGRPTGSVGGCRVMAERRGRRPGAAVHRGCGGSRSRAAWRSDATEATKSKRRA